ncbi:hypothetical protein [Meiothermus taiwanensis]|uniref:Uncharacterized protein n=1 Tax=Meiothermus taiwanensis WR-220 TaxID=1339250 RepID=A0ABM6WFB1_9DEIN|nr:hypothetical protein [Meiothermus taiwanensis]AWR85672.1 hypothetical protein Mtai_v1c04240 [Meiothermus taiwanensis WR-220]
MKTRLAKLEQAAQSLLDADAPFVGLWLDARGDTPSWFAVRADEADSPGVKALEQGRPVMVLLLLLAADRPEALVPVEVHPALVKAIQRHRAADGGLLVLLKP